MPSPQKTTLIPKSTLFGVEDAEVGFAVSVPSSKSVTIARLAWDRLLDGPHTLFQWYVAIILSILISWVVVGGIYLIV